MVLDNREQIIEIRDLIADILQRCAGVRLAEIRIGAVESFNKCLKWLEQSNFKKASGWALISLVNCHFKWKYPRLDPVFQVNSRLSEEYGAQHSSLHSLMGISLLIWG